MATPLETAYQNLTPEEQAVFNKALRDLRKKIGRAKADQVFNRIAKSLEATQGASIAEVRRRYNIEGPDRAFIQALYQQLGDLGAKAAKIDFERAAKIGDLSKKKVDLMVPILQILGRGVTAEGQFATGVGKERIAQLGAMRAALMKTLAEDYDDIYSPEDSEGFKNITKDLVQINTVGQEQDVDSLNVAANNQAWLNKVYESLNATGKPGDKDRLFKGLAAQWGDTEGISFEAALRDSEIGTAGSILKLKRDYQQRIKDSNEKMIQRAEPVLAEAAKVLGARRPQFAKAIREIYGAVKDLDGTAGAQAALDKAIAGLTPKEGEASPIEEERDRLLAALADEKDTRGPIEAAREQFWATDEFRKFAEKILEADPDKPSFDSLDREQKILLTKYAQQHSRKKVRTGKQHIRDLIKGDQIVKESGKDPEARVLPEEPETEPSSSRPSAELIQPPAVTDTVPETEDVADYDSISARWGGEPVEMRLKEKDDKFSLEIVKDGVVDQIIEGDDENFGAAIEVFGKAAEFKAETGEEPSELFGITPEEAVSGLEEGLKKVDYAAKEDAFQRDLPEDPFGKFEDDFAKEAQAVGAKVPTPTEPITPSAPILSASIEDIEPIEKSPDIQAEVERDLQTGLLRQQMSDIISSDLEAAGAAPAEVEGMTSAEKIAELLGKRLRRQSVEAGTGR